MTSTVDISTMRGCIRALEQFPARIRFRHVRIALSAGAGVFKNLAARLAPRRSGALSRAFTVKVKVPDASFNRAHHGKPAYAVIGPKRGYSRFVGGGKAITARKAVKLLAAGKSVRVSRPARYAHVAGPRRRSTFMQRAATAGAKPAAARTLHKLQQGIREEQRRLAAVNGVR